MAGFVFVDAYVWRVYYGHIDNAVTKGTEMARRRNAPQYTVEQTAMKADLVKLAAAGKREEYDALVAVFNGTFDEPEMVPYDRLPSMMKPAA